ncbi:MAG: hypothetical protein M0026_06125 [Nocardiopsaceae bacterium]|nr:hypothetical protein [Nocardiopsaceae bacterium]
MRLFIAVVGGVVGPLITQSARSGALSVPRAAADPGAQGGEYYGPRGHSQFAAAPRREESNERSHDPERQRRLWAVSEQLAGVVSPV